MLPQVKLIALLRNPVDRAYSDYWLQVKLGAETLPFEEAIEREPERLRGEKQRIILHDGEYYSFAHHRFSYLARSTYVDQLEVWQRLFAQEQMLILRSEDFFADPGAVFNKVCAFLNLASWELKDNKKHRAGHYPEIAATTREQLADYFRPHNKRLCEFSSRDFGWD